MGVGRLGRRQDAGGRSAEELLAAFNRDLAQLDEAVAGQQDPDSDRLRRQHALRDWLRLQVANPATLRALPPTGLRDLEQDWRLRRVGLIRSRAVRLRLRRRHDEAG